MPASRRELLRLLQKLEGPIRAALLRDARNITSRAQIAAMERAIEAGDLDALLRAAGIRPGSWAQLTEAIRQAYIEAGVFVIAADVPARFGATFDWTNPRAEAWLRERSSRLVTLINSEQRESIREVLEAGVRAGRNPRSIALDIVGRLNRATGRREGGIIGLNGPQAKYAREMREALTGPSGVGIIERDGKRVKKFWIGDDGTLKSAYSRRDRRFDSIIRKAIANGTALSQADINRIVGRFEDRLLALRGEMVSRTEALAALNEAADEALRQVVDEGLAPPDAVERVMDATMDSRTRPAHASWDGQVRGIDEPFQSGTGAYLMHPGDTSLGAGADDVVACRCVVTHRIDFIAVELAA